MWSTLAQMTCPHLPAFWKTLSVTPAITMSKECSRLGYTSKLHRNPESDALPVLPQICPLPSGNQFCKFWNAQDFLQTLLQFKNLNVV